MPVTRQPAAVVFDLDGTLVDTVPTRIAAWLAVFAEEGIHAEPGVVSGLIGSDGRWLARTVASLAGIELDDARAEAIDARSGAIYGALNVDPRPLSGARDVTQALDRAGIPWAIATSSRREQVRASVEALKLARVPVIVDGTHVRHAKPDPELLLLVALQLGVDPAGTWYVGDSTFDMEAAVAAGMRAVGVTTGAVDAAALRAAGAAEVIGSLERLPAVIGAGGPRSIRRSS
jgi:beta-phosphoglucomutase-like phosphatase (HAD superfamily)